MRVSQLAKYHYSYLGPSQGHNNIGITKIYVNTTNMYIYIYIHAYTHTYTDIYIQTPIHIYIHTYRYIYTYIHTHICIHKKLK